MRTRATLAGGRGGHFGTAAPQRLPKRAPCERRRPTRTPDMKLRRVATACIALSCSMIAPAQAAPVLAPDMSCFAPAGDPAPSTSAWVQRDNHNQYCASLRNRDQLNNPAFGFGNLTQGASLYINQATLQLGEPGHVHGGFTTQIPGSQGADPFRTIARWTE